MSGEKGTHSMDAAGSQTLLSAEEFTQRLRAVGEEGYHDKHPFHLLMHQGKLDALTSDFSVTASTGPATVITLIPKDKNVSSVLSSLEVRMTPDLSSTREVIMHEPSGDLTRIIFRRERRDVKFPAGTFDQTKPVDLAGVREAVGDGRFDDPRPELFQPG